MPERSRVSYRALTLATNGEFTLHLSSASGAEHTVDGTWKASGHDRSIVSFSPFVTANGKTVPQYSFPIYWCDEVLCILTDDIGRFTHQ